MRITVDTDRCVGAGQCVLTAPAVFDQDHDGVVEVHDPAVGADEQDAVALAATLCPSGAITVQRD
ncbi:ferredoxin [Kitasatospora aureofaciens]|uniref:ferredoxin n=1 Tax=Kitasatospora aureofaciens TaxID=1894 RepID=UPI001C46F2CF|nr:ferredoxin [Kitasatospora aureofaciens]MBV6701540.1 ferredoxin [Kitasatospora aureofaciens]